MNDKVLVIDDDPAVQEVIRRILIRNGFEVCTAPDGRVGLRELELRKPDLVLVDMIMPDIGGIEFLSRLAKSNDATPVIAVSGNTFGKQFLRSARSLGARSVLTKPFTEAELIHQVHEALGAQEESEAGPPAP